MPSEAIMSHDEDPQINMSRIGVAGVGGLGMVAVVGVMAYALPEVGAFLLISCIGGAIAGAGFIAYRRWLRPEPPHGPTLMVETSAAIGTETRTNQIDGRARLVMP
jgi:hypothetical protein